MSRTLRRTLCRKRALQTFRQTKSHTVLAKMASEKEASPKASDGLDALASNCALSSDAPGKAVAFPGDGNVLFSTTMRSPPDTRPCESSAPAEGVGGGCSKFSRLTSKTTSQRVMTCRIEDGCNTTSAVCSSNGSAAPVSCDWTNSWPGECAWAPAGACGERTGRNMMRLQTWRPSATLRHLSWRFRHGPAQTRSSSMASSSPGCL